MKRHRIWMLLLACLLSLAGCKSTGEDPAASPQAAYEAFLSGDLSLFDQGEIDTWALDAWSETILPAGELEYTFLDLDGDQIDELIVQRKDDPGSYNGVFHFADGNLSCWQNDMSEMSCWDYPLGDGTMVRQYDFGGSCTYTLFRYQPDGEMQVQQTLLAREEQIPEGSTDPCPYYEIDGEEVDKSGFDEQFGRLITEQVLDRSAWTAMQTD